MQTFWNRLTASDPGLLRLMLAVRATLSVVVACTLLMVLALHLGLPITLCANGVVITMITNFMLRDPTPRERMKTVITLGLTGMAASLLTASLHGVALGSEVFFLVAVFCAFLVQAYGMRAIGVGLVTVVISYVDLYLQLPPSTVGWQMGGIVLAECVTSLVNFVLLPMRPLSTLKRAVRAVQRRAALVLRDAHAAEAAKGPNGAWRDEAWRSRSLARLNEAALACEDQLALLGGAARAQVRLQLFNLELAVARLMLAVGQAPPGERHRARLRVMEARLRHDRWAGGDGRAPAAEGDALHAALAELDGSAGALGRAAAEVTVLPPAPPAARAATPRPPLAWRVAFRVTLASALAMAGGMALSPQRWFWAVITVYVVFLGARSRGDAAYKGAQRLGGTFAGLFAGLLIAWAIGGDLPLGCVVMLAAVFCCFYIFAISYTLAIFSITILLGLIYSMMGTAIGPLLLLRLEETAVGAACAVGVGLFVMPVRTRDQVRRSGTGVLTALQAAVRASRERLEGAEPGSALAATRKVDRQVADLRLALLPLTVGRTMFRRAGAERPFSAILACAYWARMLAAACEQANGDVDRAGLLAQAGRIEARIAELATAQASGRLPDAAALDALPDMEEGPALRSRAAEALENLERALNLLSERLVIGAVNGYALES